MLLPLQGALITGHGNPGRCPGLGAGCPFGARQHWFKKDIHDFETILNTLPLAFPSAADFQFGVRQHWFKKKTMQGSDIYNVTMRRTDVTPDRWRKAKCEYLLYKC